MELTRRERVLRTLNFQVPDRIPKDLGGMRSTSISAFAYPKLVASLGLPPRLPRIEDTGQMLALPDLDVLDALDIDVATICDGVTNTFDQPTFWHPYDFNGRLHAQVRWPKRFKVQVDGTILQRGGSRMVKASTVFDSPHGGQPLDLRARLPHPDLRRVRINLEKAQIQEKQVRAKIRLCQRVRESTDRAVFFNDGHTQVPIGIDGPGGLAVFPVLCITEPDFVAELHELVTEYTIQNLRMLLPEISPYIDIIMLAADDWGTQTNLIASPNVFRQLFLPYYQRLTAECHRLAPGVKVFLHSCGAIFNLIDLVIESGFDILNPVQWPAGGHSYREWKDKARGRIALWGGGINSQATLPLGSMDELSQEVRHVTGYMSQQGGYVFCNIHNLLAEIPPEKVIALYRSVNGSV